MWAHPLVQIFHCAVVKKDCYGTKEKTKPKQNSCVEENDFKTPVETKHHKCTNEQIDKWRKILTLDV